MTAPIIGDVSLYDLNMYFFIFAFLGWIAEVVFATLKTGKFVNRGFLNGPVCPIYGVGMAVMILFLSPLTDKWWLLFLVGGIFSSALEFVTGLILDKIFKTKWWDYSKEPFNLKGYVCLRFAFLWAIGILILFFTLVPLAKGVVSLIPYKIWGQIILGVLWTAFTADLITDIIQLKNLKTDLKVVFEIAEKIRENSDKVGEKVSDATIAVSDKFKDVGVRLKKSRLYKAFPALGRIHREIEEKTHKNNDK